jgi:hypothetical protein
VTQQCKWARIENKRKGRGIYIPSCGHDLEESDGSDEVVVIVNQKLPPTTFSLPK